MAERLLFKTLIFFRIQENAILSVQHVQEKKITIVYHVFMGTQLMEYVLIVQLKPHLIMLDSV